MSTSRYQYVYKCWNDCQPDGCPSHIAYLQYQSVSNSLHFFDGKDNEIFMQTYEAFERYLLTHPIQKIRAVDAIKLFAIVLPLSQAQGIQPEWNIQDIIGKQERKDEDGKE